jgi:hypothetical protein
MVRPEAWELSGASDNAVTGRVTAVSFLGDRLELRIATALGEQAVMTVGHRAVAIDETVNLRVAADRLQLLPLS